jgi:hypothetical protein
MTTIQRPRRFLTLAEVCVSTFWDGNLYRRSTPGKCMKKPFVIGLAGALFGLVTAFFVILTATSSDMTLSGVQAALFSSLGMGGAAISKKETRFAGWMLLSSAVWITLSVPVAGTLHLLFLYAPAILLLGIAAVLCFNEPEEMESPENEDAEN